MIELFAVDGLQKKAAVFDPKKLEWMNGQHLSRMPADELAPLVTPALVGGRARHARPSSTARRDWYLALLDLLKVRARTIDDIVRQATPYFRDEISYDRGRGRQAVEGPPPRRATSSPRTRDALGAITTWEPAAMEEALRELAEERGFGDRREDLPAAARRAHRARASAPASSTCC